MFRRALKVLANLAQVALGLLGLLLSASLLPKAGSANLRPLAGPHDMHQEPSPPIRF